MMIQLTFSELEAKICKLHSLTFKSAVLKTSVFKEAFLLIELKPRLTQLEIDKVMVI